MTNQFLSNCAVLSLVFSSVYAWIPWSEVYGLSYVYLPVKMKYYTIKLVEFGSPRQVLQYRFRMGFIIRAGTETLSKTHRL
jgi:hypothetical protein